MNQEKSDLSRLKSTKISMNINNYTIKTEGGGAINLNSCEPTGRMQCPRCDGQVVLTANEWKERGYET